MIALQNEQGVDIDIERQNSKLTKLTRQSSYFRPVM